MAQLIRCESLIGFNCLVSQLGGQPEILLSECGISTDLLLGNNNFLPYRDYILLLETASEQLACPDFGTRLAATQTIDILGPLALVAKQATNLGDALQWVVNYIHFHAAGLDVRVTVVPEISDVLLTFSITLLPLPRAEQTIELTLALACKFTHFLSGGRCDIKAIHLPHTLGSLSRHTRQVFRCKVHSDQPVAAIRISAQDLLLPIDCHQDSLSKAAGQYLQEHCNAHTTPLCQQVSVIIKAMLMFELCTNQTVANALNLSVRQLHRRLSEQGTSFVKLKSLVRKELSIQYFTQKNLSLGRIAELLGYQEQSAFTKACWQWFGCGAKEAQRKLKLKGTRDIE